MGGCCARQQDMNFDKMNSFQYSVDDILRLNQDLKPELSFDETKMTNSTNQEEDIQLLKIITNIKNTFKERVSTISLIELFKTFSYIALNNARDANVFKPYGFIVFTGAQGNGKSLSAVQYLDRLHERYPKAIISTNMYLLTIYLENEIDIAKDLILKMPKQKKNVFPNIDFIFLSEKEKEKYFESGLISYFSSNDNEQNNIYINNIDQSISFVIPYKYKCSIYMFIFLGIPYIITKFSNRKLIEWRSEPCKVAEADFYLIVDGYGNYHICNFTKKTFSPNFNAENRIKGYDNKYISTLFSSIDIYNKIEYHEIFYVYNKYFCYKKLKENDNIKKNLNEIFEEEKDNNLNSISNNTIKQSNRLNKIGRAHV